MSYQSLNRQIVSDATFNLLSVWWELGYRDMPHGYKDLINLLFPHHTFGQAHSSFIRSACEAWEEKYQTPVGYLVPKLKRTASKWHSTIQNKVVV